MKLSINPNKSLNPSNSITQQKIKKSPRFLSVNDYKCFLIENQFKKIVIKKNQKKFPSIQYSNEYSQRGDIDEIQSLANLYRVNSSIINYEDENKMSEFEGKNLLTKFNIKENLNSKEKGIIDFGIKSESNFFRKKKFSNNSVSKVTTTKFYENPYNSLKDLKHNKQIVLKYNNLLSDIQSQIYDEKFQEIYKIKSKIEKMPKVKIASVDIKKRKFEANTTDTSKGNFDKDQNNDFDLKNKMKSLEFFGYFEILKNKPPTRRSCTLNVYENKLILFGGICDHRFSDIWVSNLNFNKFNFFQVYSDGDFSLGRFGHSSVVYKNYLLIFGGDMYGSKKNQIEDILIYNISQNKFYFEMTNKSSQKVKWRKYHIGEILGNTMFIYGGIDNSGKILKDVYLLDLSTISWEVPSIKGSPFSLAYHSSAIVIKEEKLKHPDFSIYQFPELIEKQKSSRIVHEGIYIFGGMDEDFKYSNRIKIFEMGNQNIDFFYKSTNSKPPSPRIHSSLNFLEELNIMVIHGGKDENQNVLSDFFILTLDTFSWVEIAIYNQPPVKRCQHSCVLIDGTKLIIFGGFDSNIYLGSDLYLIDFEIYQKKKPKIVKLNIGDDVNQLVSIPKKKQENRLHSFSLNRNEKLNERDFKKLRERSKSQIDFF